MAELQQCPVGEFVLRLKDKADAYTDSKFVFFIGAGCSISSKIPGASDLVRRWLPRLKFMKTESEDGADEWAADQYNGYSPETAARFYPLIIRDLLPEPEDQQREIEKLMEGKDPGFGYSVLAQLMTHEKHRHQFNHVLTVNFDDLVTDALYLYTNKKPLVIYHESLAGYWKLLRVRPTIIKLHGDARIQPKSGLEDTKELDEKIKRKLRSILTEVSLIFVGYGANDISIASILEELPADSLPGGIYWVNDLVPDTRIGAWLANRKATWINHLDFDELMMYFWRAFQLGRADKGVRARTGRICRAYKRTMQDLITGIADRPQEEVPAALSDAVGDATEWGGVELEANRLRTEDPEKADEVYREGLAKFPESVELTANYALFLHAMLKDYDRAEELYMKALQLAPDDAVITGNYASFSHTVRKDYDKAEELYNKALELDPFAAHNASNYAGLLLSQGKKHGLRFVDMAVDLSAADPARISVLLECNFYRYAHSTGSGTRLQSLQKARALLVENIRSPRFDLSQNVERAIQDGHPEPEFLKMLAKVIAEEVDISELDQFEVWRNAGKESSEL